MISLIKIGLLLPFALASPVRSFESGADSASSRTVRQSSGSQTSGSSNLGIGIGLGLTRQGLATSLDIDSSQRYSGRQFSHYDEESASASNKYARESDGEGNSRSRGSRSQDTHRLSQHSGSERDARSDSGVHLGTLLGPGGLSGGVGTRSSQSYSGSSYDDRYQRDTHSRSDYDHISSPDAHSRQDSSSSSDSESKSSKRNAFHRSKSSSSNLIFGLPLGESD